jgi:branched-chain amino acid transport system ATP-binding protein
VRQVRESGIATVIVDKNFAAVNRVTDRNVILVKGRVVYEGAAADLRAQPQVRHAHLGI